MRPGGLELQAVLLCAGRGSRLPTLLGVPPKCLLPVGPYPLIWYPLNLLERQEFLEVIVVVLDIQKAEISTAIEKLNFKMKIEYASISSDEDMGTADSLKSIHDRIVADVLILSCDLITDTNLDGMLELYRKHNASAVSLLFDNRPLEYIQVPGPKSKDKLERDLIGIDKETQRLIFLASASDFEEIVTLPSVLLKKHSAMSMYSKLLDSHAYILKKWVVDFIFKQTDHHFTTIKGELLPYIIKKQLSKPKSDTKDIYEYATQDELNEKIRRTSSYNDHASGMKGCYHDDIIRCYAYMPPQDSCYGIRVNTLSAYCVINSKIIKMWDEICHRVPLVKFHSTSDVKSKQVDEFTIVGEKSLVSEKTSIKGTTIGSNCTIENKVCLTNCILMNNVTIKEGCNLQDCILYSGVTIEPECNLKFCLIGPKYTMPANRNEVQNIFSENHDMIHLN